MKTGIIDVGGGYRDIYGAGILDVCMHENIVFDVCVGVSAGSANLASYLSGQIGRSYKNYLDYVFRKEYMSVSNWFTKNNYTDTSYLYDTIWGSKGEDPLDFQAMMAHPAKFFVAACDACSGALLWYDKSSFAQDCYDVFKAACALPVINSVVRMGSRLLYDGGMVDPVPVKKAFEEGCDKVVVILTRPTNVPREQGIDMLAARLVEKRFPAAAARIRTRCERYNEGVAYAMKMQEEGRALVLAPDNIDGMTTLTRDKGKLETLYHKGVQDARRIFEFLGKAEKTAFDELNHAFGS